MDTPYPTVGASFQVSIPPSEVLYIAIHERESVELPLGLISRSRRFMRDRVMCARSWIRHALSGLSRKKLDWFTSERTTIKTPLPLSGTWRKSLSRG
jgi:hypothetical protein